MTLLRRVLGETLRGQRLRQRRTLREVSGAARVSLGYLSEVERGQKEASSELLASICEALDVRMSDLLREVSDTMRRGERAAGVARAPGRTLVPAGVGAASRGERGDGGRGGDGAEAPVEVPVDRDGFDRDGLDRDGFDRATASVDRIGFGRATASVDRDRFGRATGPLGRPGRVGGTPADPTDRRKPDSGGALAGVPAQPSSPHAGTDARSVAADLVPAGGPDAPPTDPAELDGVDLADLDGVDLADLDTGDGLAELDTLLGLTELAGPADGPAAGACSLHARLAGAAA